MDTVKNRWWGGSPDFARGVAGGGCLVKTNNRAPSHKLVLRYSPWRPKRNNLLRKRMGFRPCHVGTVTDAYCYNITLCSRLLNLVESQPTANLQGFHEGDDSLYTSRAQTGGWRLVPRQREGAVGGGRGRSSKCVRRAQP